MWIVCIYELEVQISPLSTILMFDFGIVPTLRYFLFYILFIECGYLSYNIDYVDDCRLSPVEQYIMTRTNIFDQLKEGEKSYFVDERLER